MKSAEEVAKKVAYDHSYGDTTGIIVRVHFPDLIQGIAKALTDYAEARVKEAIEKEHRLCLNTNSESRDLALEAAAKVADHMYYDQPYEIARAIRALKNEGPGAEGDDLKTETP